MEQNNDIRQLLHLASEVLQDIVCSAAAGSASDENILKKTNEILTSKMIRMIALLSQYSIDQGNASKQARRQEKKTARYIEDLRDCITKQNEEIKRLETSLQGTKSSAPETNSAGVNTDFIDSKDSIIERLNEELSDHRDRLKQTELKVSKLEKENRTIRKSLAKANMMLRTQQILLEEQDNEDYMWKESHSKGSAYREPEDEEEELEIRTKPSSSFEVPPRSSAVGSTKRISVRLPPSIGHASLSAKKSEAKLSDSSSVETISVNLDAPLVSESDNIGDQTLSVVSSPDMKMASSGPSRRYFESSFEAEHGDDSHDRDFLDHEESSVLNHSHNDRHVPVSMPPTDVNHSFEEGEDMDFSMESIVMDEKQDESSLKDSDPSMSRLKDSDDSFALISDYYDDYFRSHGHIIKDNIISDH